MRILIDAMGGDNAPEAIVKGAAAAGRDLNCEIVLIGDESKIKSFLTPEDKVEIIHTTEVICAEEPPRKAARTKRKASMVLGLTMLKRGEGDAFVSAGATGALMTAASLYVGRIKGIRRMSLAAVIPVNEHGCLLCDSGANMDCSGELIAQFGMMGSLYMKNVCGIDNPKIGLLNVGTEEGKGNTSVKEAYDIMKEMPMNFVGNIEARDVFDGKADVLAADGFAGNVLLKGIEGTAMMFSGLLKSALTKSGKTKMAAIMMKEGIKEIKSKFDYTEYGGAPLLGASCAVIKAHGSSNEKAFYNAVRQAVLFCEKNVIGEIQRSLEK